MCEAVGKKNERRTKVSKDAQPFHSSSRLSLSSSIFQPEKPTLLSFVLIPHFIQGPVPKAPSSMEDAP